jgi:hypothetical protein
MYLKLLCNAILLVAATYTNDYSQQQKMSIRDLQLDYYKFLESTINTADSFCSFKKGTFGLYYLSEYIFDVVSREVLFTNQKCNEFSFVVDDSTNRNSKFLQADHSTLLHDMSCYQAYQEKNKDDIEVQIVQVGSCMDQWLFRYRTWQTEAASSFRLIQPIYTYAYVDGRFSHGHYVLTVYYDLPSNTWKIENIQGY